MCPDVAEYGVRSAVEMTSAMVKLAFECLSPTNKVQTREIDESKSDVINTVRSATDSVRRQSSRHPGLAWKMVFSLITRGLCVFLKPVTKRQN